MAITDQARKLLWGRAGGVCSFPNCGAPLSQVLDAGSPIVLGEEAHVRSGRTQGPRFEESFSIHQIDSYANLVLLCPTHHTLVDKASDDFPTSMILAFKAAHEDGVARRLARSSFGGLSNLPLPMVPFVGRNLELTELGSLVEETGVAAIVGGPGTGKTRLAIEFARALTSETLRWVVRCSSRVVFDAEVMALARALGHAETDGSLEFVIAALSCKRGWVLVLDDADDWTTIEPLASLVGGTILVTTRVRSLADPAMTMVLQPLEEDAAVEIIMSERASGDDVANLQDVVHLVGGLPLALVMCRLYLAETQIGADALACLVRDRMEAVAPARGFAGADRSLSAVVDLAFERVDHLRPGTRRFANLLARLGAAEIPLTWITQGREVRDHLALGSSPPNEVHASIVDPLVAGCLLERRRESVVLHPAVRLILRNLAPSDERSADVTALAEMLLREEPFSGHDDERSLESALRWVPHAVSVAGELPSHDRRKAALVNDAAVSLNDVGHFGAAVDVMSDAVMLLRAFEDPLDFNLLMAMVSLGAYAVLDNRMLEASLAVMQTLEHLGSTQQHTVGQTAAYISAIDQLACLSNSCGGIGTALSLYERVVVLKDEVTPDSFFWPHLVVAMGNFGAVLASGRRDEARTVLEWTLAAKDDRRFARPHAEVVRTLYWLVGTCSRQGDSRSATRYLEMLRAEVDALSEGPSIYRHFLDRASALVDGSTAWNLGDIDPVLANNRRFAQLFGSETEMAVRFAIPVLTAESYSLAGPLVGSASTFSEYWRRHVVRRAAQVERLWGRHSVRLVEVDAVVVQRCCDEVGARLSRSVLELAASLDATRPAEPWPPKRNYPCPCGSGSKFKVCCGATL